MPNTQVNIALVNILNDYNSLIKNRDSYYVMEHTKTKLIGKLQLLYAMGILETEDFIMLMNVTDNVPSDIEQIIYELM